MKIDRRGRSGLMWALLSGALSAGVGQVVATESAHGLVPLDAFTPPVLRKRLDIAYPSRLLVKRTDGWVQLGFMVDPAGKPYEITVVESTNEAFNATAIKSVSQAVFTPATLGGKPIDASGRLKINFLLSTGASGAHPEFSKQYRKLIDLIEAGDRVSAEALLASMDATRLYEFAYKNLAEYQYYARWGTERQQLGALRRAANELLGTSATERYTGSFLSKEQLRGALNQIMALELRLQDFAAALATFESLKKFDPEGHGHWQDAVAEIERLRKDSRTYRVEGVIDVGISWKFELLKSNFVIDIDEGNIAEIKVRCDRKYVAFPFRSDLRYHINENYGACWLEVIGDPGTRFHLTQS